MLHFFENIFSMRDETSSSRQEFIMRDKIYFFHSVYFCVFLTLARALFYSLWSWKYCLFTCLILELKYVRKCLYV